MAAAAVSARVVRITAGSAGIPVQTNAAKMLPFVVSALKSYPQITIVLENHGGISSDIENHVKIFKRVHTALAGADRDRFSLCLDPTNVPKGDPIPHWQRMAPFTAHVHLKAAREDQPIDLKRLNSIIDKSHQDGFEGWYVVEDLALLGTG